MSVKEHQNKLSSFYSNLGAKAGELPVSKRVFTEEEVQLAISRALMAYGVFKHIETEGIES
ncbi:MAG: hypothetical protein GX640_01940 [Fibrobacter sp.]|nr:hypothetical protein [Fibrobacter sp.]